MAWHRGPLGGDSQPAAGWTSPRRLAQLAAARWSVEGASVEARDGRVVQPASGRSLASAELAHGEDAAKAFPQSVPAEVHLTPVKDWKVLGTSLPRPNRRNLVTGAHKYPSDHTRPGMRYGKVLRPPTYGARLLSVDLEPARAMPGAVTVRERVEQRQPDVGIGLACGTEKGSIVAACVEIAMDREQQRVVVRRVGEVFECGAILNPQNLEAQTQGCILMGLGPALREETRFEIGRMRDATFSKYLVPRFSDVPELDIHLLNRPDLASADGGETPIIAIAPAVANAVFHATGTRLRALPVRLPGWREA